MILFYNANLVDKELDCQGAILVDDKKIKEVFIGSYSNEESAKLLLQSQKIFSEENITFYNVQGLVLEPAFIDMHVHYRYPGLTQKEDLNTGLMASAAGGFGTVVAMPNTKPVVSSMEMAEKIMAKAKNKSLGNLFQTVSITKDFDGKDISHLESLDANTVPVISEDGFDVASSEVMLNAMKIASKKGITVSCHSEDPELTLLSKPYRKKALELMKQYSIPTWGSKSQSEIKIPQSIEDEITQSLTFANKFLALAEDSFTVRNLLLAEEANCKIHIAHVSTKKSIDAIKYAKANAKNKITSEITPHHLALSGEKAPEIHSLVNPPLRTEADRLSLIQALRDGTADVISTDHAPHTMEDKANGSPGFSGEETAYAVCNTVLVTQNNFSKSALSSLMSSNPAKILNLKKGRLLKDFDADFVLLNPNEKWIVEGKKFFSKGKATPFEGMELVGKVYETFVAGKKIFSK